MPQQNIGVVIEGEGDAPVTIKFIWTDAVTGLEVTKEFTAETLEMAVEEKKHGDIPQELLEAVNANIQSFGKKPDAPSP